MDNENFCWCCRDSRPWHLKICEECFNGADVEFSVLAGPAFGVLDRLGSQDDLFLLSAAGDLKRERADV